MRSLVNFSVMIMFLFMFPSSWAANQFPTGQIYPLGEINATLTQTGANDKTGQDGNSPDNWSIAFANNMTNWVIESNVDQYYGYQIRQGVLLVFYNGTISGPSYAFGANETVYTPKVVTGTWGSMGRFTVSPSGSQFVPTWAGSAWARDKTYRFYRTVGNGSVTTVNVKYGLYFSSSADRVTSVAIPDLFLNKYVAGIPYPYVNYKQILQQNVILPPPVPTTCTINLQDPTVNFGMIQQTASDTNNLGYVQSALNINCSEVIDPNTLATTVGMNISFTGTQGRYTNTLALKGTEGQGNLAEVRGSRSAESGGALRILI
ncbi:hypothetical protein LNP02_28855 [Klebsiella variicola subsp. variicola]|nr:hypothetical protein [Klebsiella variicola subsp. variicola]